jgi:protease-4
VWSGLAALERGLVDTLGGLDTAIELARREAGLADQDVVIEAFPRVEHHWYERIFEEMFREEAGLAETSLRVPPVVRAWIRAAERHSALVLALMPIGLEIR